MSAKGRSLIYALFVMAAVFLFSGCYTVVNQNAYNSRRAKRVVREVTVTERVIPETENYNRYEENTPEDYIPEENGVDKEVYRDYGYDNGIVYEDQYRGEYDDDGYIVHNHYYSYPDYYYPPRWSTSWTWFYDPYWDYCFWPRVTYYPRLYMAYDPFWWDSYYHNPWYWSRAYWYSPWYAPYNYAYGANYWHGYHTYWYDGYYHHGGGGGGGGYDVADRPRKFRDDRLSQFGINSRRGGIASGGGESSKLNTAGLTADTLKRRNRPGNLDVGSAAFPENGATDGTVTKSARRNSTPRALTSTERRQYSVYGSVTRRGDYYGSAKRGENVSASAAESAESSSSVSARRSRYDSVTRRAYNVDRNLSGSVNTARRSSAPAENQVSESPENTRSTNRSSSTVNRRDSAVRTYYYSRSNNVTPTRRSSSSNSTSNNMSGIYRRSVSPSQSSSASRSAAPSYQPYPGTSSSSSPGGFSRSSSSPSMGSRSSSVSGSSGSSSSSSSSSRSRASSSSGRRR